MASHRVRAIEHVADAAVAFGGRMRVDARRDVETRWKRCALASTAAAFRDAR